MPELELSQHKYAHTFKDSETNEDNLQLIIYMANSVNLNILLNKEELTNLYILLKNSMVEE